MSWAPAAGIMKRDCCVLAPDLRGHGLTSSADDSLLSLETLTEDVVSLLAEIFTSGALIGPPPPAFLPVSTTTTIATAPCGRGGGPKAGGRK